MAIVNSLQRFRSTDSSLDILWVGTVEGMETDIVTGSGIDIEFIESSGLVGKGLIGMIKGLYRLLVGLMQSYILISRFSPDAIFVTGGYTTVPVSVAGWLRQVPIAIYLPDVEPGLAIRIIS
ncbi:MAG TPA: UDP-N-acetylglucosamine--N-acetylmuramyl-(pentapeptide) pyrophosphoryl-undecaprenol N-acetylglucosamine transferase, partial [Chloroflexi bacterium]|nr:UDP-N-acetylglucosamine--N-acetylmuramyl-(pentapeptide) pyrophosphoryl-undecaprenol N-acetylglucosamine transferase [Chloroflexota bacterium]